MLDTDETLDDDVVNFSPHQVGIYAVLFEMFTKGAQAPLVA